MIEPTPRPIRVVMAAGAETRRLLRDGATLPGMQIAAECTDSAGLLEAVLRERPEVCVLDRDLAGGSLPATAAITSPARAPMVLIVGGRAAATEVRAARLAGASHCLPAGADTEDLAAALAALIRQRSSRSRSGRITDT